MAYLLAFTIHLSRMQMNVIYLMDPMEQVNILYCICLATCLHLGIGCKSVGKYTRFLFCVLITSFMTHEMFQKVSLMHSSVSKCPRSITQAAWNQTEWFHGASTAVDVDKHYVAMFAWKHRVACDEIVDRFSIYLLISSHSRMSNQS